MSKIRVVIADDHALMRIGIRNLLNHSREITVVGEASNGEEAIRRVEELHPDVLLLDMEMPVMDGVEAARQLHASGSPVRILVLSAYNDRQYIEAVLEQGASGYITKDEAPGTVEKAIVDIYHGKKGWFSRKVAARVNTTLDPDAPDAPPVDGEKKGRDSTGDAKADDTQGDGDSV